MKSIYSFFHFPFYFIHYSFHVFIQREPGPKPFDGFKPVLFRSWINTPLGASKTPFFFSQIRKKKKKKKKICFHWEFGKPEKKNRRRGFIEQIPSGAIVTCLSAKILWFPSHPALPTLPTIPYLTLPTLPYLPYLPTYLATHTLSLSPKPTTKPPASMHACMHRVCGRRARFLYP